MDKQKERFLVRWEIDIFDATTAEDAAKQALAIQRDTSYGATFFEVYKVDKQGKLRPDTITEVDLEK